MPEFSRFHTTAPCSPTRAALLSGRSHHSVGMGGTRYSGDEMCDIGSDTASPVSTDYTPDGSRFTGAVEWVRIDVGEDLDHLISPEEHLKAVNR